MKRFIAILLAMVMVLGLGTMAMAAAPNEKVQINNMMVDSSLVEAKTDAQAVVEEPAEQAVHVVQTTSTQATLYPPINSITVAGCASSSMDVYTLDDDSNIYYKIYTHGTTIASGANTFTIQLSNGTSFVGTVRITDVDNSENHIDLDKNQSGSITLNVAADGKARFTASWRVFQNLGRTVTCVVEFDTTSSVSLYKNGTDLGASVTNVDGVSVVDKDFTAGGVTRYGRQFTLPASATANDLDLQFKLESGGASATLGGATPSSISSDRKTITFDAVDLTNPKELVITNGTNSRTYTISAATSQTIRVFIGIRTYLAHEWISNGKTYYDYESNGFGYGDGTASSAVSSALEVIESTTGGISYPAGIDATSGRPYFISYEPIDIHSGASVMEVLTKFAEENGIYLEGADNNYISGMGADEDNLISEFDCGSGSGWMYTVRNDRQDYASSLPNVGAGSKIVTAGQYIDWYYTAAYGMDFGYSIFDL